MCKLHKQSIWHISTCDRLVFSGFPENVSALKTHHIVLGDVEKYEPMGFKIVNPSPINKRESSIVPEYLMARNVFQGSPKLESHIAK